MTEQQIENYRKVCKAVIDKNVCADLESFIARNVGRYYNYDPEDEIAEKWMIFIEECFKRGISVD